MDLTIARRLIPPLHLVEKSIPRFRIEHPAVATDGSVAPRSAATPPNSRSHHLPRRQVHTNSQHGFVVALVHSQGGCLAGTIASIAATPFALAQDQTETRHVPAAVIDSGQQRFIIDNALALSKMTLSMTVDPTGALNCDRELSARFCRGGAFRHSICGEFS
jgi:hypothetical protein